MLIIHDPLQVTNNNTYNPNYQEKNYLLYNFF